MAIEDILKPDEPWLYAEEAPVEYIKSHESIDNRGIGLILYITQAANQLLKSESSPIRHLDSRVFLYNREGIVALLREGKDWSEDTLQTAKALLWLQSARAALAAYRRTQNISWARIGLQSAEVSAGLASNISLTMREGAQITIGELAKEFYRETGDTKWAQKAHGAFKKAIGFTPSTKMLRLGKHFNDAYDMAKVMYKTSKSLDWLLEAHYCAKSAARYFEGIDTRRSATLYGFAADASRALYRLTRNPEYAIREYNEDLTCIRLIQEINPRHAGYTASYAAQAARQVFIKNQCSLSKKISWALKSYEADLIAAELLSDYDERHAKRSLLEAGFTAADIYSVTKQPKWKDRALRLIGIYVAYTANHPEKTNIAVLRRAQRKLKALQGKEHSMRD